MANDFTGDANCKALWRFESGALTTDSKGSNTLTDNNTVGTDTTNYKEGAASADFEEVSTEYFSITDANLDSGFPLKSGEANKNISVCFWMKVETFHNAFPHMFSKRKLTTGNHSFGIGNNSSDNLYFLIGYNSGDSSEAITHASVMSTATWYHVAVTFDDSDKSYQIRIWDDTAGAILGTDKTGTSTNNISITTTQLTIGARSAPDMYFDGLMDEVVVFDDVLSTTEIDAIRAGTYGAGSGLTKDLSDTMTMSDSESFNIGMVESDTITMSDTIINSFGLNKSDTISLSENIVKSFGLNQADTITMSDNFNAIITLILSLNDTINMSDNLSKSTGLNKSDTINLSDNISYISEFIRSLSDTVNLSDIIAKEFGTSFSDTINMTDNFDALVALILALNDSITMSDSLVSKDVGLNKSDTISLSDEIIKSFGLTKSDIINISDHFSSSADIIAALLDFVAKKRNFNFNAKNKTFNFNAKPRGES